MFVLRGALLQGFIYMLVIIVFSIILMISLFSSITFVDIILVILGLGMGLFAAYILFHQFNQERSIHFFPGENMILKSTGPKSYVVIKNLGEHVFQEEHIKADIYLTNLGIIAEIPDTAKPLLFIPHDTVIEYQPHESGIIMHYLDHNNQLCESMIYVEDRNAWLNTLYSMYSGATRNI